MLVKGKNGEQRCEEEPGPGGGLTSSIGGQRCTQVSRGRGNDTAANMSDVVPETWILLPNSLLERGGCLVSAFVQ